MSGTKLVVLLEHPERRVLSKIQADRQLATSRALAAAVPSFEPPFSLLSTRKALWQLRRGQSVLKLLLCPWQALKDAKCPQEDFAASAAEFKETLYRPRGSTC